jgi:hypothetical protein
MQRPAIGLDTAVVAWVCSWVRKTSGHDKSWGCCRHRFHYNDTHARNGKECLMG